MVDARNPTPSDTSASAEPKRQLPPVLDKLSPLEEAVIDAARRGTWVQPGATLAAGDLIAAEDLGLRVRADLIRELLMGRRGELDPQGVLIRGVRVIGRLNLDHLTAVTGVALVDCALPDGITCQQARLHQVSVSSSVIFSLNAENVRIDGHFLMSDARITGSSEDGALRLAGAHIGGKLDLDGVTITDTTGPALDADGIRIDSDLLVRSARITGSSEDGAFRLVGAHIGGYLNLDGVTITNTTGPALHADDVRTNSNLFLRDARITGTGERGAFRLIGAHISSQLDLDGVIITNIAGPALVADGIRIDNHVFLRNAHITGAGEKGALRLPGSHSGGQAHLTGTQVTNESGPLVMLSEAQVIQQPLFFSAALVCPQSRREVVNRPCPDGARRMVVRGFVFTQLRDVTWREWLHLLVHHTPEYLPQPYQQLAAVERAAGHDNNARTILITQQHDLRRRAPDALGGSLARARHWLWGWLGHYGYRAHRLVTALLIALILAGATGYTAGQITTRPTHHTAERVQSPTTPATAPGIPCSTAELIGLGIDRGLPVGATGLRARCDLDTTTRRGQAFTYLLWALQALLWALATLTIAAYTGLIRKTT
ncbi:hypothetical protein SK854_30115 [Lentzea sp. BCCO 10_0061]|uniref:Membrane-associated oxidoreductase n=1 Tax=Lentzea sokolovensis TaxID=3095429 RepID=A0ABU4V601_9PSEU|nr:hypothetical protein [Lentzea sp. BCCO 10_0061]MDX8146403.1 hypothetical protein [Lentzea sp. BCCO 10_0061]